MLRIMLKSNTKAHLALLGTNVFFAINFTAIKELMQAELIKPFGLNLLRIAIPTILLWILFLFKPQKTYVQKKDYGRFFWCALTGIAINQLMFIKGLSLTYSIHASLLMLATPIFVSLLAAWLLKIRLSALNILGLALGTAGAVIIISAKSGAGNASNIFWGDMLIILNAISYSFYFILVKPLMKTYPPIMVIRMIFTIGLFMMLPFCWTEFVEIPWSNYGLFGYGNLFLIIFCGTFLAYIFNVYGIKILGPAISGNYIYLQPVFAAAIAMYFLGEALTMYKIIAAICIAAGVYFANKKKNV